ncbi:MAG: Bax inhibitor-1/YccA family protein [Victivallales bacterium]|jgi:FtsH-binding integral membrane protein|nr:Bax inhibitor-1/YccA family protein [Victivallales bacterium]
MNKNQWYDRINESEVAGQDAVAKQGEFVNRVFGWMTVGLALTGAVAWAVYNIPQLFQFVVNSPGIYTVLIILELVVVIAMSAAINKLSAAGAAACFVLFSILNGLTLSWIFAAYQMSSLAATFFVTSGTFGGAGLYGYLTKRDLSGVGGLAILGLWGLILASIVNIFWYNNLVDRIICYLGVLIFIGLTAWDIQKIKRLSSAVANGEIEDKVGRKYAVYGALELYLDFVNLFLFFLRLFGGRR